MNAEGDCCQSQVGGEGASATASFTSDDALLHSLACCSLEDYPVEISRNVRVADDAAETAALSQLDLIPKSEPRAQTPHKRARLPDLKQTHILCRVFLI